MNKIRVTVWNEYRHERSNEEVKQVYPQGIHHCLAEFLGKERDFEVRTATLDDDEHGLSQQVLDDTDVLLWWGHKAHDEVSDEIVDRVHARILNGMGFVPLHSAHYAKITRKLMGTSSFLKWRVGDDHERLWVVRPNHPITAGIGEYIELEREEMYGEFFDVPEMAELLFISWFKGGEVCRSGFTFRRGLGNVFYFRPGHETFPTYYNEQVQRVIVNGIRWAAPVHAVRPIQGKVEPLE